MTLKPGQDHLGRENSTKARLQSRGGKSLYDESGGYNENVLDLFYDSMLDEALKAGETVFGSEADAALRELEAATVKIDDDDYPDADLINAPQMQIVREKAAKALVLVKASTGDGGTVEIA